MSPSIHRNQLLALLSQRDRALLMAQAETVLLESGVELYAGNRPIERVYFPLTLVASVLVGAGPGNEVEIATIGNEGMLGISVVLGTLRSLGRTVVQVRGTALKLPAETLRTYLAHWPVLRTLLAHYLYALTRHMLQLGVCHRLHRIEARCAGRLLMMQDRVGQETLVLTQQSLAKLLGVRRATVNLALQPFKRVGLIDYIRGHIRILDRDGLEAVCCPCYAMIATEYQDLATGLHDA